MRHSLCRKFSFWSVLSWARIILVRLSTFWSSCTHWSLLSFYSNNELVLVGSWSRWINFTNSWIGISVLCTKTKFRSIKPDCWMRKITLNFICCWSWTSLFNECFEALVSILSSNFWTWNTYKRTFELVSTRPWRPPCSYKSWGTF